MSEEKSRVYFSPNVDDDNRALLSETLGFQPTASLGKYLGDALGVPNRHPGFSNQDFNYVLDRVKSKLAGWKSNLLSMAGRAMLIQSSPATVPNYAMQCANLPSIIVDNIDRINQKILWGSTESSKKMHWIRWEKVTKPKSKGGLGLQTSKGRNTALLAKLNWRFHSDQEALWARVLRKKYCNPWRLNARNSGKLHCSHVWTTLKKGEEVY